MFFILFFIYAILIWETKNQFSVTHIGVLKNKHHLLLQQPKPVSVPWKFVGGKLG